MIIRFVKLTPLISLILYLLIITTSNHHSILAKEVANEEDQELFYILDKTPTSNVTIAPKTRLRVSHYKKIRAGMRCHVAGYNICNGVKADKGTRLLYCCKKHCRNILGDMNNCGQCGHKCRFGQRCCGGLCTNVGFNPNHCGKCNKKCKSGVKCEYGYCGYA